MEIKGYRQLSEQEVALINEGKELSEKVGDFVHKLFQENSTDKRWVSEGKTDLQKGFMSLIRSIAQPTTF